MLIGTYALRLNGKCALRLPKKIAAELCPHIGPRQVCFASAEYMLCYSLEGARAYGAFRLVPALVFCHQPLAI